MKKSQVTLFVIIGIAVLFLIVAGIFISKDIPLAVNYANPLAEAANRADICLENSAKDTIYKIGVQGGYYNLDDVEVESTEIGYVSYWYFNGYTEKPTKDEVRDQLEIGIKDTITPCLKKIPTSVRGVTISNNIDVTAEILGGFVTVKVQAPITAKKGSQIETKQSFEKNIYLPLGNVLDDAYAIYDVQQTTGEYMDLTYFSVNIKHSVLNLWTRNKTNMVVFQLFAPKTEDQEAYVFSFAWQAKPFPVLNNTAPVIINPAKFVTKPGDKIYYKFEAYDLDNDTIIFGMSTDEFGFINETSGEFTADITPAMHGYYPFDIYVTDEFGNENFINSQIYVEEQE